MTNSYVDYCHAAGTNCKNPAGYGISGVGACDNDDPPRTRVTCSECGNPVCSECRGKIKKRWICELCSYSEGWDVVVKDPKRIHRILRKLRIHWEARPNLSLAQIIWEGSKKTNRTNKIIFNDENIENYLNQENKHRYSYAQLRKHGFK